MKKRVVTSVMVSLVVFLLLFSAGSAAAAEKVLLVPVEGNIEPGLAQFLQRGLEMAEEENYDLLLLEMDTPGGRIDAAVDMKNALLGSEVPTAVYVKGQALSAGSLIALSCDTIVMGPGAVIGDAEPLNGTEFAGEKVLSAWREELASAAKNSGRDEEIAKAFADRDMAIEGVIEEGKLLTLTAERALELGMAELSASDRSDALAVMGYEDPLVDNLEENTGERVVRFLTNPVVAPILLTIGIAGIAIEVFTVGFGFAGVIGLLALILFFGGSAVTGLASWWPVFFFIVGLILLGAEVIAPGFGLFGISGIAAMVVSIVLVSPSLEAAVVSLTVALAGTIILVLLSFRFLTKNRFWNRLALGNRLSEEEGYTASAENLKELLGSEGVVTSLLRPSGTMELEDGRKIDVVSEAEYISAGERVRVIKVESNRVVVRRINSQGSNGADAES